VTIAAIVRVYLLVGSGSCDYKIQQFSVFLTVHHELTIH